MLATVTGRVERTDEETTWQCEWERSISQHLTTCSSCQSQTVHGAQQSWAHRWVTRDDEGMREVMASLLHGLPSDWTQQNMAQIVSLPMRMGGLGLGVRVQDGTRGFLGVLG